VGDKGLGDTTKVDVQHSWRFFEHALGVCLFTDKAFSGKNQVYWSGDYFPQVRLSGFPD